jgi:hypothetical protein
MAKNRQVLVWWTGLLDIGACLVTVAFDHGNAGLRQVAGANLCRGEVGKGSEVAGINGGGTNMEAW